MRVKQATFVHRERRVLTIARFREPSAPYSARGPSFSCREAALSRAGLSCISYVPSRAPPRVFSGFRARVVWRGSFLSGRTVGPRRPSGGGRNFSPWRRPSSVGRPWVWAWLLLVSGTAHLGGAVRPARLGTRSSAPGRSVSSTGLTGFLVLFCTRETGATVRSALGRRS